MMIWTGARLDSPSHIVKRRNVVRFLLQKELRCHPVKGTGRIAELLSGSKVNNVMRKLRKTKTSVILLVTASYYPIFFILSIVPL